ncbi:MAG TPA: hypothetical protein VJ807_00410 [Gaiellaceae bacterium]|nr:hypothetical protein [Gaiellaceae bacterium]
MILRHPLYLVVTVPLAAAAIFAGGYWAGLASAAPEHAGAPAAQTFPDWFLPIWDAYDLNPAITPEFDFASLYSGDLNAVPGGRR